MQIEQEVLTETEKDCLKMIKILEDKHEAAIKPYRDMLIKIEQMKTRKYVATREEILVNSFLLLEQPFRRNHKYLQK